jgi:hypothetical protein
MFVERGMTSPIDLTKAGTGAFSIVYSLIIRAKEKG